jgi:ArsR family transcriptional regulator
MIATDDLGLLGMLAPREDTAADDARGPAADPAAMVGLIAAANDASAFLKALGHDGRLTILCHLAAGPRSVTELENLLASRQAVVSQQLARLRFEGLVRAQREGQMIYYSILDPRVHEALALLARLFAAPGAGDGRPGG